MDINDLSNEERETHLNQCAADRSQWVLFSEDPVAIRRVEKIAGPGTPRGVGYEWTLDASNVLLRKTPAKRTLTPKQREQATARLKALRQNA